MMLDYTALTNAIRQLKESYDYSISDLAKSDHKLFQQFRSATIQAFEYTYELSIKMIRRKLEALAANPEEIDRLSFKDLIREAAVKGFIKDPKIWFEFREYRNLTSHTYNVDTAEDVYSIASTFIDHTQTLLKQLQSR